MLNDALHYPRPMRLLHWLIAVTIITLLAVGLYMSGLEDSDPSRGTLYMLHKATGFTLLGLVLLRIVVRLKSILPPLPAAIAQWEAKLAHVTHMALYAFMLIMPISGLWMSNAFGHGVNYFGLFTIPPIFPESRELGGIAHEVHEYGVWILIALLVAHVAGVLKHRFIDKHDVLHRMTGGKPPKQ